jgi:hypothetical protein
VRGLADRLHHDIDRTARRVRLLDGKRDPLALLIYPQDDELPWFLFTRDAWRLNDKPLDARRNELSVQDFEHGSPWPR